MEVRIGIGERGAPGLRVDRPQGSGDYVLVAFLAPAFIGSRASQRVEAGDCVVWGPRTPTTIHGGPVIVNHYAHVPLGLARPALRRFPIMLDAVLRPATTDFIPEILRRLRDEVARRDVHAERAIELGVEELFLQLHRHTATQHRNTPHDGRLRDVRLRVQLDPTAPWTVEQMARLAHLRPSRFSELYRALFGRPPLDDVLETRLENARHDLVHYDLPIAEVGARSGFGDPAAFSRRFRARYGLSPRAFRARNG